MIRRRNYIQHCHFKRDILVGHDMPLIKQGNQTGDIELELLGRGGATQRNGIISPVVLIEHLS